MNKKIARKNHHRKTKNIMNKNDSNPPSGIAARGGRYPKTIKPRFFPPLFLLSFCSFQQKASTSRKHLPPLKRKKDLRRRAGRQLLTYSILFLHSIPSLPCFAERHDVASLRSMRVRKRASLQAELRMAGRSLISLRRPDFSPSVDASEAIRHRGF